jgi:hypothetical protein
MSKDHRHLLSLPLLLLPSPAITILLMAMACHLTHVVQQQAASMIPPPLASSISLQAPCVNPATYGLHT